MSPNPPQEGLHEHTETIAENAERDITASRRTQEHMRHFAHYLCYPTLTVWYIGVVGSCVPGEPNRYHNHTRISGEPCDLVEVKHGCC